MIMHYSYLDILFEELDLQVVPDLLEFFDVLDEPQLFEVPQFEQLFVWELLFSVFVFLFLPNIFFHLLKFMQIYSAILLCEKIQKLYFFK